MILPMPNLERPYISDKGSEAVLTCLQYERCAGPQNVSKFSFKKYLLKYLHQKLKGQITLKKKLKIIFRNFFYFLPKNSLGFLIKKLSLLHFFSER